MASTKGSISGAEFLVSVTLPLMLAINVLSFWVVPITWDENNELDGSWVYALGKFRSLGLSLGRDSWFTYGPGAHWFGPPMETPYHPWQYYATGLFLAGLLFLSISRILLNARVGISVKAATCVLFSCTLLNAAWQKSCHESCFMLVALLLFVAGYFYEKSKQWWINCLMVLGAVGLLIKFTIGILATSLFFIAIGYFWTSRLFTARQVFVRSAAYFLIFFALYAVTARNLDILRYLSLGVEVSSKYSELMSINETPPFLYGFAILFISAGFVAVLSSAKTLSRPAAVSVSLSFAFSAFLLFKQGHVRADGHQGIFYMTLIPLYVILIMIFHERYPASRRRRKLLSLSCLILITLAPFFSLLPLLTHERGSPLTAGIESWKTVAGRYKIGLRGLRNEDAERKVQNLISRHRELFSYVNLECRSLAQKKGRKPAISFYPWEMMFAEAVPDCVLKPSPSLQIYTSGPHSKIQRRELQFLDSPGRPDLVLIGSKTIDNRNSVAEYTDLLAVLFRNYRVLAPAEEYVLLESDESGEAEDRTIVCSDNPGGDFLTLELADSRHMYEIPWHIADLLFMPPELTIRVSETDQNNNAVVFSFRGFYSQLKGGVYVSSRTIKELITTNFKKSERAEDSGKHPFPPLSPASEKIIHADAALFRNDAIWNLPVIPSSIPLRVHYCSFRSR